MGVVELLLQFASRLASEMTVTTFLLYSIKMDIEFLGFVFDTMIILERKVNSE